MVTQAKLEKIRDENLEKMAASMRAKQTFRENEWEKAKLDRKRRMQ